MPPRIVLCYPVEARHIERIAAAMPGADVVDAGQERIAEELLAADIFCGHAKVPVDWDAVVRQGRLRWIQSSAAGMDHCLVPSVVASDIAVTSASGVLADQVAEHTIALITAWCRGLPRLLPRAAEAGVYPAAHARPDRRDGRNRGSRRRRPAAGRTAGPLPRANPRHRHVPHR